jgi:hypothetical protein
MTALKKRKSQRMATIDISQMRMLFTEVGIA